MLKVAIGAMAVAGLSAAAAQAQNVAATGVWSGPYVGLHFGGGFGTTRMANPLGPSIYGDDIRMPKALAGIQAGYNWQGAGSPWVAGIEAELSGVDADGTDTCFAYSGQFVSANCRAREYAIGSFTGRFGRVFGPQGRSLAYIKAGAAFIAGDVSITTNSSAYLDAPSSETNNLRWGWTVGAGVEQHLSPAWSIKAEYSYSHFGRHAIDAPPGGFLTTPFDPNSLVNTAGFSTHADTDAHFVKLGLNYHIGHGLTPGGNGPTVRLTAPPPLPAWQFDVGTRYWYSHGRYQNDLAVDANAARQNHLLSRLTYESTGHSGELFWRIDSPRGLFLKGFAGLGGLTNGHMNDEDWIPTIPGKPMAYSNTYHGNVTGTIGYATLDLGADLFSDADFKIGVFVGYNFYRDRKDSFGCTQIALPVPSSICGDPDPIDELAISQYEDWHSLRFGVNGTLALAPAVKLNVDAAYLPFTYVSALDNHHARTEMPSTLSPAWGTGRGMQLETILTYDVTRHFTVGVGARYWAMWSSDILTAGFGSATADQMLPIRVERYGTFLQASYKFGTM